MLSLFGGTGFIGSHYLKGYNGVIVPREERVAPLADILYLISTVDNYNIFEQPYLDIDTNLTVLVETLEANRKKYGNDFIFNFASSFFVYGNNKLPFREDMLCNPMGFYSISKYAAERYVETYCRTYQIPYRILRFANVYGPNDKFSKRKNAFQYLIDNMRKGEIIPIYGNGNFVRDMIHVSDVCSAINLITLEEKYLNQIINVGSGIGYVWLDLMKLAKDIIGSESEFKFVEAPEFHKIVGIENAYLDISKLKSYGWAREMSIVKGIRTLL